MLRPRDMALSAVVILAIAGASTAASAQLPTQPGSEDFCVFRNELYSFGAIICIGKNRALRCDGPQLPGPAQTFKTAHWTLLQPDNKNMPYSEATLGEACNIGGPLPQ